MIRIRRREVYQVEVWRYLIISSMNEMRYDEILWMKMKIVWSKFNSLTMNYSLIKFDMKTDMNIYKTIIHTYNSNYLIVWDQTRESSVVNRYELSFHFCMYIYICKWHTYIAIHICLYVTHLISMAKKDMESYMDNFGFFCRTWDIFLQKCDDACMILRYAEREPEHHPFLG